MAFISENLTNSDKIGLDLVNFTRRADRKINLHFSNICDTSINTYVFLIGKSNSSDLDICNNIKDLNSKVNGQILNYLHENKFCAGVGRVLALPVYLEGKWIKILACGVGNKKKINRDTILSISYAISGFKNKSIGIYLPIDLGVEENLLDNAIDPVVLIANLLAESLEYAAYTFDKYQTKIGESLTGLNSNICQCDVTCKCINKTSFMPKKSESNTEINGSITIILDDQILSNQAQEIYENHYQHLGYGYRMCMDLGNVAPNRLYPASFAEYVRIIFESIENIRITVLDEAEMHKLGMNCLLGVGQGSIRNSRAVVIQYTGDLENKDSFETAFVGKGVCFDTGGISLKPSSNMDKMKFDMCGAAATVGSMYTIAKRKDKVNVIGIIGLVENMPGGGAQRPGDIVTSMSGKTVEILNTDAEGRLVLIDLIEYIQMNFAGIKNIITIATLTGAIGVALGNGYAGLFSNDQDLANELIEAGKHASENLWLMPCDTHYLKQMTSTFADIANIATKEPGFAGSSTAAAFLTYFVREGIRYAHMDIATTSTNNHRSRKQHGANGFGVGVFTQFVRNS